jgi:hypothetical protein
MADAAEMARDKRLPKNPAPVISFVWNIAKISIYSPFLWCRKLRAHVGLRAHYVSTTNVDHTLLAMFRFDNRHREILLWFFYPWPAQQ